MNLAGHIRTVPDFPKPGIAFKDLTPLLADAAAFHVCITQLERACPAGDHDCIAGIESRGFIFGAALAGRQRKPFIPIRKPGKLPWDCLREEYQLEYGSDALEIHKDACAPGQRVLLIDDLLATGGTLAASARLLERLQARVSAVLCLVELDFLGGRKKLEALGLSVHSLLHVGGEE